MCAELRSTLSIGVGVLIMASGILTATSGLPLLNVPSGSIRDQNFMPVTGQAILFFELGFIAVGLVIFAAGVLFLVLSRRKVIPAVIAIVFSAASLVGTVSTGVLVIPSTMGVLGGLLGTLTSGLKRPRAKTVTLSEESWLSTFPFLLTGVGVWEFGGIFLGCGPPNGIGTGACDLLGAPFYVISMLGIASLLSILAMPLWKALHHIRA